MAADLEKIRELRGPAGIRSVVAACGHLEDKPETGREDTWLLALLCDCGSNPYYALVAGERLTKVYLEREDFRRAAETLSETEKLLDELEIPLSGCPEYETEKAVLRCHGAVISDAADNTEQATALLEDAAAILERAGFPADRVREALGEVRGER